MNVKSYHSEDSGVKSPNVRSPWIDHGAAGSILAMIYLWTSVM